MALPAEAARDKFVTQLGSEICKSGQTIRQCFDQIDTNGDGNIGIDEFRSLAKKVSSNLSETDVLCLFADIARIRFSDFDEVLTRAKVRTALEKSPDIGFWTQIATGVESSGKTPKECFDMIDVNKDGRLSQEELWNMVKNVCNSMSVDDFKYAFALVDTSADGSISLLQFQAAVEAAKVFGKGKDHKVCPQGHPLTFFLLERDGFTCDRCKANLSRGEWTRRCFQCDYDLCQRCTHTSSADKYMKVTRHVYNARGGAPPYRGSYLTATDVIELEGAKPLSEQKNRIFPSSGFGLGFSSGQLASYPTGSEAPRRWEFPSPGGQDLDGQLARTAGDVLAGKAIIVLMPMVGFD